MITISCLSWNLWEAYAFLIPNFFICILIVARLLCAIVFFYIASKRKCFSKHSHELSLVARTKNECEQDICKNINKCRARKKSIKPVCKWNDIKKRMNEQTDKIRWNIQNEYRIGTSKSKTKKIRIKFCFSIYNGLKWSTSAVPWGKFRKTMKTDK